MPARSTSDAPQVPSTWDPSLYGAFEPMSRESWPQRPLLVTLSGIDGSGKSTHGAALFAALAAHQVRAVGITSRIGRLTPLRLLLAEIDRRRRARRGASGATNRSKGPSRDSAADHWTGWRLTLWAIATVADYALWLQYVRWQLLSGNVVIADRYLCDFAVEFSILVKSQPLLCRLLLLPLPALAPRPARAYYLRVAGDVSRARKPEDKHGYDHDEVCSLYDRLYTRYHLRLVDNTRPFEEVSPPLLVDVLAAYEGRWVSVPR